MICFICMYNEKYSRLHDFVYQSFDADFFLTSVQNSFSWFYLTIKSQIDFVFYIDIVLDLPQTILAFSIQNTELFGEYMGRRGLPELFYQRVLLKNHKKFGKHLYPSLHFNKLADWRPPTSL